MENFPIKKLGKEYWPKQLNEIPQKPEILYYRGNLPDLEHKFLCVVGPRKYTNYGDNVCQNLISGLKNYPITIISGLAYGIDSIAHKYAIENNLKTIAFPGSGLNEKNIYPKIHFNLAKQILESGGTLISEFPEKTEARQWLFPKRNRLMAGMSDAVLIIEANHKSGTMITAYLALEYNRNVLSVPGSIFNSNSNGTNRLIKEGAIPITESQDILDILGFKNNLQNKFNFLELNLSANEKNILNILIEPLTIEQIAEKNFLPINQIIQTITQLELKNLIKNVDGFFLKN